MIDHWLSEDGRKAIERMGWPEMGAYHQWRLYPEENVGCVIWHICYQDNDGLRPCTSTSDVPQKVALALLRDHALGWLNEHGHWQYDYYHAKQMRQTVHSFTVDLNVFSEADYDAALIAAILGTEIEQ